MQKEGQRTSAHISLWDQTWEAGPELNKDTGFHRSVWRPSIKSLISICDLIHVISSSFFFWPTHFGRRQWLPHFCPVPLLYMPSPILFTWKKILTFLLPTLSISKIYTFYFFSQQIWKVCIYKMYSWAREIVQCVNYLSWKQEELGFVPCTLLKAWLERYPWRPLLVGTDRYLYTCDLMRSQSSLSDNLQAIDRPCLKQWSDDPEEWTP